MPDYIEVCEKAVRRAGDILLDRIGRVAVRHKGRSDLVTEADLAAQESVRATIHEAFPDHVLLGEEDDPRARAAQRPDQYRWIVDPLDGTTNYVHQVPFFAVSLALERNGSLLTGAVYNPTTNECFLATAGQGAYLNGSRLKVSSVDHLEDALVSAGFPNVVTPDAPDLRLFHEVLYHCQSVRRTGSASLNLAYVAAGRFDVAWSYATKVWDVAAGQLLIQEAGGVVTSFDGEASPLKDGSVLSAANPELHRAMLAFVRRLPGHPATAAP